ncbi:hypothetical protein DICPUDRAFT_75950 [Dictyostelium purpureum]|uniref:Uncharacterized protein n=1 Tax=Dictyostelium purpureum TaxID=5786 RepID=F0ZC51_DICPU|nr:uncharacterized protein DICPUDRAFT_75950 [Dictyostelium purpureum]EGC38463.1 hypothetical protein DICPUDRAFT_75950 [Dictyostelium purpureum]|eukprot:XP_003285021.1 hypothetical protein DICPUDRAFT_75950 [Dictyostelium purpureum]
MDYDCYDIHNNDVIKKLIELISKIEIIEKIINIVTQSDLFKIFSGKYSLAITYLVFIVLIGSFKLIVKYKQNWRLPKVIIIGTHGFFLILVVLEIINDFSKYGFSSSFSNSNSSETFSNFFMLFHTIKNVVDFVREKKDRCTCFEEDERDGIELLSSTEIEHENNYIIDLINSKNKKKYIRLE